MQKNILERIKAEYEDLTKSERRVANCIFENPQLVLSENIAELAKRANVSQPTVFRFCKKFGAKGFPDFKFALSSFAFKDITNKQDLYESTNQNIFLKNILQNNIKTANKYEEYINCGAINKFITKLYDSKRIVIFTSSKSYYSSLIIQAILFEENKICDIYNTKEKCELCIDTLSEDDIVIFCFLNDSSTEKEFSTILQKKRINVLYIGATMHNDETNFYCSLEFELDKIDLDREEIKVEICCIFSQILRSALRNLIDKNLRTRSNLQEHNSDVFLTYKFL